MLKVKDKEHLNLRCLVQVGPALILMYSIYQLLILGDVCIYFRYTC